MISNLGLLVEVDVNEFQGEVHRAAEQGHFKFQIIPRTRVDAWQDRYQRLVKLKHRKPHKLASYHW